MVGLVFRIALILTVAGVAWAQDEETVRLRWKLEAGTDLVYSITNETDAELSPGGKMRQAEVVSERWTVTDVADDGDASVTVNIERRQAEASGPQGNSSYDSAASEQPTDPRMTMLQTQIMVAPVGSTFSMTLGSDGTVKAVPGILDRIVSILGEDLRDDIRHAFTDGAVKYVMHQSMVAFPVQPVGPGATWGQSRQFSITDATVTSQRTYTVERLEKRNSHVVAVCGIQGTMNFDPTVGSPIAATVNIEKANELQGTMEFDVDRGLLLKVTLTTSWGMTTTRGDVEMTSRKSTITRELVGQ